MQPFLKKEILLYNVYLKSTPIDVLKCVELLTDLQALAPTSTPIHMPVNMFRAQVGALVPHPDERGNADILDADIVKDTDAAPTLAELQAARANLITNNEGAYQSGALALQYPELWAATGG